jgi:hypothetical protein
MSCVRRDAQAMGWESLMYARSRQDRLPATRREGRTVSDQERPRQEDEDQPRQEREKDEQGSGRQDEEQHDAISAVSEAAAELTDLIVAGVRPPTAHVELVVAVVASRGDGHQRHVECLTWLRPVDGAGRELARTDYLQNRLAEHVRERVADSTAELLTNPVWEELENRCREPDYGGVGEFTDKLTDWNHDLLREACPVPWMQRLFSLSRYRATGC